MALAGDFKAAKQVVASVFLSLPIVRWVFSPHWRERTKAPTLYVGLSHLSPPFSPEGSGPVLAT